MDELPDLDRLSVAEKDDLIRALFAHVKALTKQVETLTVKVTELEGRLAQNSRNSSRPPSSDGLSRPKPKALRKTGQKPRGLETFCTSAPISPPCISKVKMYLPHSPLHSKATRLSLALLDRVSATADYLSSYIWFFLASPTEPAGKSRIEQS
jgi:transposase